MKSLVIYESQLGNTNRIAQIIAEELGSHGPVHVVSIAEYVPAFLDGVDLVAVGGPTQAHGMTPAMQTFVNQLESRPAGIPAVAFDTRVNWPLFLAGSAARGIHEKLAVEGFKLIAEPECFLVGTGKPTRLLPGEEEHATQWAKRVVLRLPVPV